MNNLEQGIVVNIISLNDVEKTEWNDLLLNSNNVNYFCSTDYWMLFDEVYCLQVRSKSNELIGGILFSIENMIPIIGRFFRVSRAESSVVLRQSFDNSDFKNLVFKELVTFLKNKSVIYFTITPKVRTTDAIVYDTIGFKSSKCGTYMLNLSSEVENLKRNFSKGCKSSIQKAINHNVVVKIYIGVEAISHLSEYLKLQDSLIEFI